MKRIIIEPTEHSRFSPSAAHRWLNCAASLALPQEERGESEASWHGTIMHEAAALALNTGVALSTLVGAKVYKRDGRKLIDTGDEFSAKMADTVRLYVEFCREMQDHSANWWVEERADLSAIGMAEVFGTVDFMAWFPQENIIMVVDLKTGNYPVPVTGNPQLLTYALGAAGALSDMDEPVGRATRIDAVVVQPKVSDTQNTWAVGDLASDTLRTFVGQVKAVTALDFDNPGCGGPSDPLEHLHEGEWCRFCPAINSCPAKLAKTGEAITPISDGSAIAPSEMTDDQLSRLLTLAPEVSKWLAAAKKEAVGRGGVPGFQVAPGPRKRAWVDKDAARRYFATAGISTDLPTVASAIKKHRIPDDLWHWDESSSQRLVKSTNPFDKE